MKLFTLLLCVAFVAGLTVVNAKNVNNNEQHSKSSASSPAVKPTAASSMVSTVASTNASKVLTSSTKGPSVKSSAKPNNPSKKIATKPTTVAGEKKMEVKPTEKTQMSAAQDMAVKLIPMPATVATDKPLEKKAMPPQIKAKETKPLAVTGFITQNGNIYEVDDKDGIGKIEGRQNVEAADKEHICNYGSVVVYSDVPCDAVTNVKVSQIQEKPALGQDPVAEKGGEMMELELYKEDEIQNKDNEKENMGEMKPVRRRPNSKKPRRKNKTKVRKQQKKRRNNTRRVVNRPLRLQNQTQRRAQQVNSQQMKHRQEEKRRQQKTRRQQVNHRRPANSYPQYYDNYEEDEYEYSRGRDY